ncbi:hypothetical protein B4102_2416 [Heyndrickxia sporothermodurans]|uniref:Uncharacterized protein n=1 Tax=Heyndrickxia sporothermodurans TaxID=46224 RepID=A0A150LCD6_9BACI|nr:hypothetical protein B4102_2416 [Heyndrickxia sporothermodurans]
MPLGIKPVSPYKNINAITPTSEGKTIGMMAAVEKKLLPGKSYRLKMIANGIPIKALTNTLKREI